MTTHSEKIGFAGRASIGGIRSYGSVVEGDCRARSIERHRGLAFGGCASRLNIVGIWSRSNLQQKKKN